MGIDFKRPRHIKGFKFGEVLVWDFSSKPLVEKTVSGSVVTFSDGADDVPLKSCAVTIAPTLTGVSSVGVVHGGKNLIDISGTDTDNGYTADRWLSSTNTYNNNNDWDITEYLPILSSTDYTLSGIAYGNAPSVCFYDENKDFISGIAYASRSSFTFTSPATAKFVRFSIRYDFTEFMMEYGTTATAYEPYIAPTTYTANLGRTIYGGSVDVANGNCEPTNIVDIPGNLTSGTSGGLTYSASSDGAISYSGTAGAFSYMTPELDFTIKSGQTFTFSRNTAFSYIHRIRLTFSDDTTTNVSIAANNTSVTYTPDKDIKAIRFIVAGLTTGVSYSDTVYLQLQYGDTATAYSQYFTPFTFTPVPIISRLGDNTMWSDGDLSVTYYANAN